MAIKNADSIQFKRRQTIFKSAKLGQWLQIEPGSCRQYMSTASACRQAAYRYGREREWRVETAVEDGVVQVRFSKQTTN